jgi:hypothetical protein
MRYPHAVPVAVLVGMAILGARRRGEWSHVVALALGALPEAALLLLANWLRFGSLLETGYSAGATPQFWQYPGYLGVPAILLAPGKGIMWFSPPLWIALAVSCGKRALRFPLLPALLLFALPLLVYGHTAGWAAGQCWSVRFLGPSVVLLVAVALATAKPWRRHRRLVTAVCSIGFLVSLGGVITPYRGQQDLANQAAEVVYPGAGQLDNNVNSAPMFSPLHTHWIYAWLSATGRLERGGAENTTGPLFGVVEGVEPARLGRPHEDAGFRHLWMVSFSSRGLAPLWALLAIWVTVTVVLLRHGVRGLLRA